MVSTHINAHGRLLLNIRKTNKVLKMKFSEFLSEAISDGNYKKEITIEEAKKLLKLHCKDMDFDEPLWRGMRGKTPAYILEGQQSERKSIDQSNHYTVLIDYSIKQNHSSYPLRSKSVIAANDLLLADGYGNNVYAIFPYDKINIGVIDGDIWGTSITINDTRKGITSWNELFQEANIKAWSRPDSAKLIIEQIKSLFKTDKEKLNHAQEKLIEVFETPDNVEDFLIDAYNPDLYFGLVDTSEIGFDNPSEVWFSDKCIAISKHIWEELKDEDFEI